MLYLVLEKGSEAVMWYNQCTLVGGRLDRISLGCKCHVVQLHRKTDIDELVSHDIYKKILYTLRNIFYNFFKIIFCILTCPYGVQKMCVNTLYSTF